MMNSKNVLTVYWGSPSYDPSVSSWSMLYREPISLNKNLRENKSSFSEGMFICPATKDYLKNTFVFKSNLDDVHLLPVDYLNSTSHIPPNTNTELINTGGKIGLFKNRPSSFNGYSNLAYNMSWAFFCEENVTARFTPPYLPSFVPTEGAFLSSGEFDIGQWYRSFNLDYHIPLNATKFEFKIDDPLFYVEIKTDKKVEFKRYIPTDKLQALKHECQNAPLNYGLFKPLKERYLMAKYSGLKNQVLKEIKNNLVE